VLIEHIDRQMQRAADRKAAPPLCANDLHDFVRAGLSRAERRENAHIELDIPDDEPDAEAGDFCAQCRTHFESDADVRREHEEAHEHNKMWCTVCRTAFVSKESNVVRHQNSKRHARMAHIRRAEGLGAAPTKRSRTLSQRREVTQSSYAAVGAATTRASASGGGAASSDEDGDDAGGGGGFDIGGGFEVDDDRVVDAAVAVDSATPAPVSVSRRGGEADELANEKEDGVEHDSDDESSVAAETAPASPMRAMLFQSFVPAAPASRPALVDNEITTIEVPVANNSRDNDPMCSDLTYHLVALANTSGWARESCRRLFKLLHGHKADVASTYESACAQAAARDASTHVRADLLSVDVPLLPGSMRICAIYHACTALST